MSDSEWDSMVTIGRVVRPHGNRGQMVIAPETDFAADRFQPGAVLHSRRGDRIAAMVVTASREYDGRWIVGVQDVSSIDEAEALRGLELKIPADQMRALPADRFYVHDLVGCRVQTIDGEAVGTVADVVFGTGTPVLAIRDGSHERLIPFTDGICRRVDVPSKTIVIDPPAGLLDLND